MIPNSTKAGRQGFTLVELLVVVAILGLLTALLLPSLVSARTGTLRVLCAGNLRQIHVAMTMYLHDNNDVYPCAQDPVSASPFYWLWMGRGWRQSMQKYLGTAALTADNPSILLCKGDLANKNKYESTSYAYSMAFYHSPAQIDAMNAVTDTYSNAQPFLFQRAGDVKQPARKILIGEWTANHPAIANDQGWWCWAGARNYLLADGQVRSLEARAVLPARDGLPDPNLTFGGVAGADVAP